MADSIRIDTSHIDNWRRHLPGTIEQIDQAMKDATVETGLYAQRLIIRTGRESGISGRGQGLWLSGVGRGGAPLTVNVDMDADKKGFQLKAVGPWQFVEGDTKPHAMPGRRRRPQGSRGPKPYRTPYGFRSKVMHPGTRGKRVWRRSYAKLQQRYPRHYRDRVFKVLQQNRTT